MIENIKSIHMTAVCGTGMGSLAGLLKEKGYNVTGSDANVYPPMSDQLAALQIPVQTGFKSENIGNPDLVIIGNAVSKTNDEVQAVLNRGLPYLSMPGAVEEMILKNRFPIVIAGTHGKTTSSALMAWLLERTGQAPGFLVGGILKNFEKSCQLGTGDYFVIEGDEYDSAFFDKKAKFLHYHPQILILNAVEFDHADIYKNLDHVLEAFGELISGMSPSALIFACGDSENVRRLVTKAPCRVVTFGLEGQVDLKATEIQYGEMTQFHFIQKGRDLGLMTSPMAGRHNIANLLGVTGALLELGIPLLEINTALAEFKGIKRRQEVLGVVREITLIDDFAHHPTAVRETLMALRSKFGGKKIWAIFEPRSNTTRRNIFQKDFVSAFNTADEVILAAPYQPEKIPLEERLEPETLVQDLNHHGKSARFVPTIDEIVNILAQEARSGDILCFMSNGGFGGIHQKVLQKLKKS